jgi:hypothetical protein
MLVENQNEVEVLSVDEVKGCTKIAKAVHGAWSSGLKRDDFINQGSDLLVELVGTQPDYEFFKSVQGQTIQDLINLGLAVDSANTYFGYIIKQSIAKHKFIKPAKNTKDSARVAEDRKFIADKYEHVALENVLQSLQEVSVKTDKASIELQKELIKAKAFKIGKNDVESKKTQKGNIDKLRAKIESFLKVDSGRLNKKGNPIFEWSIVNLDFAYRCFEKKEEVKKFLASLK